MSYTWNVTGRGFLDDEPGPLHDLRSVIPPGICQCGCGAPTRIAKNTNNRKGHKAGEPVRYLPGHHARRSPLERFLKHAVRSNPDECWPWTASLNAEGYGRLPVKDVCVSAHRFAYLTFVGPIPDGMHLDHLCHTQAGDSCPGGPKCPHRRCCNPKHLEPVLVKENLLRGNGTVGLGARRDTCSRGHDLTGDNLYVTPSGARRCRACHREDAAARRAAEKVNEPADAHDARCPVWTAPGPVLDPSNPEEDCTCRLVDGHTRDFNAGVNELVARFESYAPRERAS